MSYETIKIFATDWCWDCRRARKYLDQHGIPYQWINIDQDIEGERFVLKTNHGMRSVPTIVFPDGRVLVEPSNQDLDKAFPTEPDLGPGSTQATGLTG